jgi:hypothetical protein
MSPDFARRLTLLALVTTLAGGGCAQRSRLSLLSYGDPYFPERFVIDVADCAYRTDASGDYHILARSTPRAGAGLEVEQLLHVHLFWRPRPGKTFDDPSSIDARLRYVVASDDNVEVYRGAGFVYVKRRRLAPRLTVQVERAQLQPIGDARGKGDSLGESTLEGVLQAADDSALAMELQRQVDLYAGQLE